MTLSRMRTILWGRCRTPPLVRFLRGVVLQMEPHELAVVYDALFWRVELSQTCTPAEDSARGHCHGRPRYRRSQPARRSHRHMGAESQITFFPARSIAAGPRRLHSSHLLDDCAHPGTNVRDGHFSGAISEGICVSSHFQTKSMIKSGTQQVLRVDHFADRYNLDEKQRRDLLALFGQFATLHELLINSRLPRDSR